MKLCILADGRAPTPLIWMRHLAQEGHEIHLISTHPCNRGELPVASLHVVPLDFSARLRGNLGGAEARTTHGSPLVARMRGHRLWDILVKLKNRTAPWSISWQRARVRRIIERTQPDLVHAMRIPFEGMLAAEAVRELAVPLVLSVWGNDFTMGAASSRAFEKLTRRALARADGLHPDCERDLRLARGLGFSSDKPSMVLPGYAGVRTDLFYPGQRDRNLIDRFALDNVGAVVINPRGMKPYVRNDTFFQAIPIVLARRPGTIFLGAMMQGNGEAQEWIKKLGIGSSVRLLPYVSQTEMAQLFRLADVTVSVTEHDGTPNSLLEAMATGVFPVVGDVESVREWIEDGINGLVCEQGRPDSLAAAILRAIDDTALREAARDRNRQLIVERADFQRGMAVAASFYKHVVRVTNHRTGHPAPSRSINSVLLP